MKRYLALLMAILCFASVLAIPMEAAAPKIIGKVLTTDIRAYINGAEIPAYNIDGNMVIVGSDLRNYGFSVVYDNNKRTSSVTLPKSGGTWNPMKDITHYTTVGRKVMDVYATDIKVLINGKEVQAYNVDNKMAFKFSELKVFGDYKYNNATRTTNLTTVKVNQYKLSDLMDPFVGEHNKTLTNETMGGVQRKGIAIDTHSYASSNEALRCYASYNLDGNYDTITGYVGYLDGQMENKEYTVEFYGDNVLLDSARIVPGDLSVEFSLNISGVKQFKVHVKDSAYGTTNHNRYFIGFGDLVVSKFQLDNYKIVNPPHTAEQLVGDYLSDLMDPFVGEHYKILTDETMGGVQRRGIAIDTHSYASNNEALRCYASYNLNGDYDTITGYVGYLDKQKEDRVYTVEFYGDNVLLDSARIVPGDVPVEFSLNISGVKQFKVHVKDSAYGTSNHNRYFIGFGDMIVY